jgi:uncharacterized protein (TIGR02300 family)
MSTLSAKRKAMRGTKRTCLACEVRFYDLARSSIVCPSCGAPYTPAPEQIVQSRTSVTSFSSKTGWRNQPFKRPRPEAQVADPEDTAVAETMPAGDAVDEAASETSEDDVVLDDEQDEAEVSGLIDQDVTEPNER